MLLRGITPPREACFQHASATDQLEISLRSATTAISRGARCGKPVFSMHQQQISLRSATTAISRRARCGNPRSGDYSSMSWPATQNLPVNV